MRQYTLRDFDPEPGQTEEDWAREVFVFGSARASADVVLRRIVLRHLREHLESLRKTVAAP